MIRYGLNLNKALRLQCREWILTGARVEAGGIVKSVLQEPTRDESGLD